MTNLFLELGLIVALAGGLSIIAHALRQPLIVAYIVTGILISPFLGGVERETIATLSHVGVALLLFIVGIGLSPTVLRRIGRVAIITGLIQIALVALGGFFLVHAMGVGAIPALYSAAALAFSSTIIVVRLLGERQQLEGLRGQLSVGILLIQDLVAVFLLMGLSAVEKNGLQSGQFFALGVRGAVLLLVAGLLGVYVLPRVMRYAARSQELLLVLSLAWLFAVATVFSVAGFSIEVGALVAGVALSVSVYRFEISARLSSMRDFFVILFFVLLGPSLNLSTVSFVLVPAIILTIFVLMVKPLVVMMALGALGYTRRTYFAVGMALAQVSEFSFILLAHGVRRAGVPEEMMTLIILVGIFTIIISTYLIHYNDRLYRFFEPVLGIFERPRSVEPRAEKKRAPSYILFGHNRIGYTLLDYLEKTKANVLVVDYDPLMVDALQKKKIAVQYGDAGDTEMLRRLPWKNVQYVISTIPREDVNTLLIATVRREKHRARVVVTSHDIDEALRLYKRGADFVIMPHFLGGTFMVDTLKRTTTDGAYFKGVKERALRELRARQKEGHEHPKF